MTRKDRRRRLRRTFYVVLLAALVGLTVSFWSWVDAQARAVMVISSVLSIATTAHYRRPDGKLASYEATPFLSYVVARSLVAALPSGEDRRTLSEEIASVDRKDPDPPAEHPATTSAKPLANTRTASTSILHAMTRDMIATRGDRRYTDLTDLDVQDRESGLPAHLP